MVCPRFSNNYTGESLISIESTFADHATVMHDAELTLPAQLESVASQIVAAIREGGKVLIFGNGGSAADAQHFAAELVGRYELERDGIAAIALTTDTSALTSIANDFGYEQVFARQVQALANAGDVVIGISTSGNSANVLAAIKMAKTSDCWSVGLTGSEGGQLADLADVTVRAPSDHVARIQEVHELCLHALAEAIESALAG